MEVVEVCFGTGRGGCMVGGWRRIGDDFEVEEGHFGGVGFGRIEFVLPVHDDQ